jgi:hypothetical protein
MVNFNMSLVLKYIEICGNTKKYFVISLYLNVFLFISTYFHVFLISVLNYEKGFC